MSISFILLYRDQLSHRSQTQEQNVSGRVEKSQTMTNRIKRHDTTKSCHYDGTQPNRSNSVKITASPRFNTKNSLLSKKSNLLQIPNQRGIIEEDEEGKFEMYGHSDRINKVKKHIISLLTLIREALCHFIS